MDCENMKSERVAYIRRNMFGKILDIGANQGLLHRMIDDGKMIGLDIVVSNYSKRMVRGSAEKMPFKENSFDTIIAGEVLEHLPHPEKFMQECKRVLQSKGIVIISTPNRNALINKLLHKFDCARTSDVDFHRHVFTEEELKTLASKYFNVEEFSYLAYDEIASPEGGGFYFIRKMLNSVLPRSLREEMIVKLRKK